VTRTMKKEPNYSGARPGQRQRERIQRQQRRQRRNRIITSIVVAVVLVIAVIAAILGDQRYNAYVVATNNAHATATANAQKAVANATANALNIQATALVKQLDKENPTGPATPPATTLTPTKLSGGLEKIVLKPGSGPAAQTGNTVTVTYTGWLQGSNKKFDSSYDDGGQAFPVTLGQGQVIKGWDEGLIGIQPGETIRLIIPPALGYGSTGSTDQNGNQVIPPNATLIFDVTCVNVQTTAPASSSGS